MDGPMAVLVYFGPWPMFCLCFWRSEAKNLAVVRTLHVDDDLLVGLERVDLRANKTSLGPNQGGERARPS